MHVCYPEDLAPYVSEDDSDPTIEILHAAYIDAYKKGQRLPKHAFRHARRLNQRQRKGLTPSYQNARRINRQQHFEKIRRRQAFALRRKIAAETKARLQLNNEPESQQ